MSSILKKNIYFHYLGERIVKTDNSKFVKLNQNMWLKQEWKKKT